MSQSEQRLGRIEDSGDEIPVFKADLGLGSELLPFLEEINESGVYSNFGPQVARMEGEFAKFVGVLPEQVVSAGSATLGIQGSMVVLDQETWVLPSWSFAATAHAGLLVSESVYFGDVNPVSWTLEPSQVVEGAGAVVTAPFGAQVTIGPEWNHVGALVVDAAASVASFPIFHPEFCQPWAIAVSLHATKILGIGEGGFVVFGNTEMAKKFRQWTNFGFWGSREAEFHATNAKMSEVSAAIARLRLLHWPEERDSWLQARLLVSEAGDELGITPQFVSTGILSPYWVVEFRSHSEKLAAVRSLNQSGISSRDWWSAGCHRMPAFSRVESVKSLEVTDDVARRSLGLPFFRGITSAQVSRIRLAIEETRA